jgi:hypothetical protein
LPFRFRPLGLLELTFHCQMKIRVVKFPNFILHLQVCFGFSWSFDHQSQFLKLVYMKK